MKDQFENLKEATKLMKQANSLLNKGPTEFYINKLIGSYEYMMNRFCPLSEGDRVVLIKKIDFNLAHGWQNSEHFLIPGAVGTVIDTDCDESGFGFDIEFDDETWIDQNGNKRVPKQKHTFFLREAFLSKIKE